MRNQRIVSFLKISTFPLLAGLSSGTALAEADHSSLGGSIEGLHAKLHELTARVDESALKADGLLARAEAGTEDGKPTKGEVMHAWKETMDAIELLKAELSSTNIHLKALVAENGDRIESLQKMADGLPQHAGGKRRHIGPLIARINELQLQVMENGVRVNAMIGSSDELADEIAALMTQAVEMERLLQKMSLRVN